MPQTARFSRALIAAALCSVAAVPAWADNCPMLAQKTLCVTATNNFGGSWTMTAVFGSYDPITGDGAVTLGGNRGGYRCSGNHFARISVDDTTGDHITWIALVGPKGKRADGTGTTSPSDSDFRYRAVLGACPAL